MGSRIWTADRRERRALLDDGRSQGCGWCPWPPSRPPSARKPWGLSGGAAIRRDAWRPGGPAPDPPADPQACAHLKEGRLGGRNAGDGVDGYGGKGWKRGGRERGGG